MAELFGRTASGEPEAELWIGAHPDSPSHLEVDGERTALDDLLASDPDSLLGTSVATAHGRLPFLLKVLAAGAPLSLQVHPTLAQARRGFAAENAAGVPRDATYRNYRDDNHKPEMLYALTEFTALCGFRQLSESAQLLRTLAVAVQDPLASAELERLARILDDDGHEDPLGTVFAGLLNMDDAGREAHDTALKSLANDGGTDPALLAAAALAEDYPKDPGPVLSLLLNLVTLKEGEAIWLPAGNVHAYLEGLGIEVMSSSDNVLRGGLTEKHVDVDELMKTVDFTPLDVPRVHINRTPDGEELLQPPCSEFQLQRITFDGDANRVPLSQNGPCLVLAVHGEVTLTSGMDELTLAPGESAFVPASEAPTTLTPRTNTETVLAFGVTVPSQEADRP